jgi:hypothetical protein
MSKKSSLSPTLLHRGIMDELSILMAMPGIISLVAMFVFGDSGIITVFGHRRAKCVV